MKFVPPRRVVAASAVSVLLHLTLFGLLALFSGGGYSLPTLAMEEETPAEPLVFEIETLLPEATPEPLPEATPEPQPLAATPPAPPAEALQPLRTALDPEGLKESAQAPEKPVFVASHHSRASAPAHAETTTPPAPAPEPPAPAPEAQEEAVAAPFQAAETAPPSEAESEDEVGIDAIGDWKKAVGNRIGSRWNEFRESQAGLLAVGSVRVRFAIDAKGDVSSLKIVSSTASETNAEYALRAIREADLPPIPRERLARVPGGRIEIEFTFTIFPNR